MTGNYNYGILFKISRMLGNFFSYIKGRFFPNYVQHGGDLCFVTDELKNNKEFILKVIKKYKYTLSYASDELKNDKDVVLAAVKQDIKNKKETGDLILGFSSLEYASDELKKNREVVLEAVKQNWFSLLCASDELKNDKDVLNAARDFLMSDKWVQNIDKEVFAEAKGNLLRYDEQDKREKELKDKLEEVKLITSMKPERTGRKKI